jgi:hypothetical protein
MIPVLACPVCGEIERTIVAEYNRLIFLDSEWQGDLARYDYALCHGCGWVHPSRRPNREEYEYLYAHFNEFLLREGKPNQFNVPELTPKLMQEIDRQFVTWQELDSAATKGHSIRRRLRHELADAKEYLALVTAHISLSGTKILHLRAKSSTFAQYSKQVHGVAQVDIVTLFPAHQYLAKKNPDMRVITDLDYQDFRIPFAEKYDVILENHILLHMVDSQQTFAVFRSHLNEGGAIVLRGELADVELFKRGRNLFSELRPFHFNHFDQATLARMLKRHGFDLIAIEQGEGSDFVGLARLTGGEQVCPRIGAADLRDRLDMYRAWRDESILSLPRQRAAALFGSELPQVWQRVERDGRLKLRVEGIPLAFRKVGELSLPIEALELGMVGGRRRRFMRWLFDRTRADRVAEWLAVRFPKARLGAWLKYRVTILLEGTQRQREAVAPEV